MYVTSFCIFLGDSLISSKSKKQSIVCLSSTEVEYRAMISTTKEIVWLRWLLGDMWVFLSHPTSMYCDNKSAIQITHNSVFMNESSTFRLIVTIYVIILSTAPSLCLSFLLHCSLQIYLPSCILFSIFIF